MPVFVPRSPKVHVNWSPLIVGSTAASGVPAKSTRLLNTVDPATYS